MDELLRARLRIPQGARLRLKALRMAMQSIDLFSRGISGQAFFALRETEEALIELNGRTGPDLIWALMARNGGTKIRPIGLQNVPLNGPVLIGSTHPIGTFDFLAHAAALLEHRPDLKVVANREAQRFLGVDRIIPVDLDRKDTVLTARQTRLGMLEHLGQGGALLVFGSGKVPDIQNGRLTEPEWRTGITRMSKAANAPIVPASPDMRNSRHYYRTRKVARLLSGGNEYIGREVASLRYVSELLAKLGGSYDVHYGRLQPPGTHADDLKRLAEGLVPGLYTDAE
ncbi:MAG: hypothetical protein P8H92_12335 [Paracoccaceae bacterium]|nr:hypothetical protein [Paracoccaceae bacterium]